MNMTHEWIRTFATRTLSGLLICVLASLPVAAEEKDQCEGTKKQRRQKMALRDLTKAQLLEMQGPYASESIADREHLSDTVLRRLEREYENHLKTGADSTFSFCRAVGPKEPLVQGSWKVGARSRPVRMPDRTSTWSPGSVPAR